jgi:ubiquinone/menaquinone biosynthesis C-methylase UbiE
MKSRILETFYTQKNIDLAVKDFSKSLKKGDIIIDLGAGSQRFREEFKQQEYKSQDYYSDILITGRNGIQKQSFISKTGYDVEQYKYAQADYNCDIVNIPVANNVFDAAICTEVFEHIKYPTQALKEIYRILKPGARVLITMPISCIRHMDPVFYNYGLSDNWFAQVGQEIGFSEVQVRQRGNYKSFMAYELVRSIRAFGVLSIPFLMPAFIFYFFSKWNRDAKDTMGQHYYITLTKGDK